MCRMPRPLLVVLGRELFRAARHGDDPGAGRQLLRRLTQPLQQVNELGRELELECQVQVIRRDGSFDGWGVKDGEHVFLLGCVQEHVRVWDALDGYGGAVCGVRTGCEER